jgi:hypothetical protein
MKFNATPFISPARQLTCQNYAWAIDFAMLDLDRRPLLMMVVDVQSRRPLSATATLAVPERVAGTLERLVRREGTPEEIWTDHGFDHRFHPALQAWSERHRISITYGPMPAIKALAEPILRDLSVFLRDKRFATLMELGHEIERWRQSHTGAARPLPDVNQ